MRRAATLAALLLASTAALAHVRLVYWVNGNPLFWDEAGDVEIVIHSGGSDDIASGGHFPALRNAIAAWNGVTQVDIRLDEDKSASSQARDDWESNGIHLMLFDESNQSGYFPPGSGVVAVTPIEFFTSGRIIDADVLFNGSGHQFTTSGLPGRFDVQDVATHELGHLLGLDHSGWAGSTMFPYVDPTVILHRSLSLDDVHGLRHIYPSANFASIRGRVVRASDSSPVAGAHVVAVDSAGRTAGAALAKSDGIFRLRSLEPGNYEVYATPLDEPVSAANLGGGQTVHTDFESTVLGTFALLANETLEVGDHTVGPDVSVGLGRPNDPLPLRAVQGTTTSHRLSGSGLTVGSTLEVSDPALTVTPTAWFGSFIDFDVSVPPGAAPGHVDLTVVTSAGDRSTLAAAMELTPPDPVVLSVTPSSGAVGGGAALTLTGTGFRAGARVVIGDRVYADGAPSGCNVESDTTITLTTGVTIGGLFDVVVIDSTGVEGRLTSGFRFTDQPVIDTVFPVAGAFAGGTRVILEGDGFVPGFSITIDGVVQPDVTWVHEGRIEVFTEPGVVGGPYVLELQNPGGDVAQGAFVYAPKPDPVLTDVAPRKGPSEGGRRITVSGSNFTTQTRVVFGARAANGAGGRNADSVTLIDSNTLEVVTPSSNSSSETVLVRELDTQQAFVLPNAYRFESEGGEGSGGGGCATIGPRRPPNWGDALAGGAWMLLAALLLARQARSARAL